MDSSETLNLNPFGGASSFWLKLILDGGSRVWRTVYSYGVTIVVSLLSVIERHSASSSNAAGEVDTAL